MQVCVVSREAREADRFWVSRSRLFAGAQNFPIDDSEQSLCQARSIRKAFWKTGRPQAMSVDAGLAIERKAHIILVPLIRSEYS
jgi:hypothetical protein